MLGLLHKRVFIHKMEQISEHLKEKCFNLLCGAEGITGTSRVERVYKHSLRNIKHGTLALCLRASIACNTLKVQHTTQFHCRAKEIELNDREPAPHHVSAKNKSTKLSIDLAILLPPPRLYTSITARSIKWCNYGVKFPSRPTSSYFPS